MERFGFVGLPNAGKSSLFNALTGGGALAAPYPFATKDPNLGSARCPTSALQAGGHEQVEEGRSTPRWSSSTSVVWWRGRTGEGLGNKFLGGIREVDAIVYVLRAFHERRHHRPARPDRTPLDGRDRAHAGRPAVHREPAAPQAKATEARQVGHRRGEGSRSGLRNVQRRHAYLPVDDHSDEPQGT